MSRTYKPALDGRGNVASSAADHPCYQTSQWRAMSGMLIEGFHIYDGKTSGVCVDDAIICT